MFGPKPQEGEVFYKFVDVAFFEPTHRIYTVKARFNGCNYKLDVIDVKQREGAELDQFIYSEARRVADARDVKRGMKAWRRA